MGKIKKALIEVAITFMGGVDGLVGMAIDWFNSAVLSKIEDKEECAAYCSDVENFALFLDGVFQRHKQWLSDERREALVAIINALREIATALKDAHFSQEEVKAISEKAKLAVAAWKKSGDAKKAAQAQ